MAEKRYWLDSKANVTKLVRGLWAICTLLLLADFVIHRHEEIVFAEWFGFFSIYGFAACVGLVLAAKELRKVLKRPENYYDR